MEDAIRLEPGTPLGPYEVVALIGSGGMGEVYRARDTRLGREVAVKILTGGPIDSEQARRFEHEARTTGTLNHPNIVAVYDVGSFESTPYVVTELLEGETLRDRMSKSLLAPRKALDCAIQVAAGLAAAHDKGVCHRDIKPENLFLTKDGRVKILDFGLAKTNTLTTSPEADTREVGSPKVETRPGTVLGTVGYMSPEQVRGDEVDHRTDIFALGAVLYEMLSGKRAFKGRSPVDTMACILQDDPPSLLASRPEISPALDRLLQHCLEKDPEERFQSVRDLAFGLKELRGQWESSGGTPIIAPRPRPGVRQTVPAWAWVAVASVALLGAGWFARNLLRHEPAARFTRLTFEQGTVLSARFTPDAESVVYGAAWRGEPPRVFLTLLGSPESRPIEPEGASVLAVSATGELALVLDRTLVGPERYRGKLARVPLQGGAPREVLDGVEAADWAPSGEALAVVRSLANGGASRLEFPIGTVLFETNGGLRSPRVSPGGDLVAFLDDPTGLGVGEAAVAVVDLEGKVRRLTDRWANARGLAWSPSGKEIWFTASDEGAQRALRAVALSGAQRLVMSAPGAVTLRDIADDGRVLLTRDDERRGILARVPDQPAERELGWFHRSGLADLSADGRTMLFGDGLRVYLRHTDGSPAVFLGEGYADRLSPDGKWALTTTEECNQVVLVPTGAGEPRRLPRHSIRSYAGAGWFPDATRILFTAREADRPLRCWVQSLEGGPPRPVTPERSECLLASPDGAYLAAVVQGEGLSIVPAEGGERRPVPESLPGDRPSGWSADGQTLWVSRDNETPKPVYRLTLSTPRRELWGRFAPADPTGVVSVTRFLVTPDGRSYAYSYRRNLSQLYLVEGLE